ncbi:hypothetical protein ADK60_33485 [Streptomyces sp. XY431]|nr:hypothetical protein ADK60_33485 [Streptomyces sp. XY431]
MRTGLSGATVKGANDIAQPVRASARFSSARQSGTPRVRWPGPVRHALPRPGVSLRRSLSTRRQYAECWAPSS